ncbi:hypothetical protein I4U23_022973 [Adineta vaga]|nr:hypothetical protein I4U23_022973 [Adineta vaga]
MFDKTIGHLLNIYVFTRPTLYSNSCGRYFLAATISGMLVVLEYLSVRALQLGYNIDLMRMDGIQNDRQHGQLKKERQLIRMTIGQALLLGLPSAINSITHLYIAPAGVIMAKDDIERAIIINAYHIIGFISLFGPINIIIST